MLFRSTFSYVFRTNLLTRCHSASSLFSAVFGFRKVVMEIFLELDEINTDSPIFTDTCMESRGETEKRHEAATHGLGAMGRGPAPRVCVGPSVLSSRRPFAYLFPPMRKP